MKCKTARSRIALWVGNDLEGAGKHEVRSHLSSCEPCRSYLREMQVTLQTLRTPAECVEEPAFRSLWPRISHRLPRRGRQPRQSRFNHWAAAASVAAAACVLVAFAVTYQSPYGHVDYAVPAQMFPTRVSAEFAPEEPAPALRELERMLEDPFGDPFESRRSRSLDHDAKVRFTNGK